MRQFLKVLWQIFVYRMNNKGESTHPCGEPVEEHTLSDKTPWTLTLCVLFVRKLKIQPTRFLLKLKCSKRLCVKMCSWIVLKAEEKSINSYSSCLSLHEVAITCHISLTACCPTSTAVCFISLCHFSFSFLWGPLGHNCDDTDTRLNKWHWLD